MQRDNPDAVGRRDSWQIRVLLAADNSMTVDKIFEALLSAPRRRILAYLSKTDMTAGEIVQRFAEAMSQPAISKHLSILENAGLGWRCNGGQSVRYGLKQGGGAGRFVR